MKYLYFSTLNELADADGEALSVSADSIKSIVPISNTTLDIRFENSKVRITFLKGRFKNVLESIFGSIKNSSDFSTIDIFDGNDLTKRCSDYISGITIYKGSTNTYIQTLANNSRIKLSVPFGDSIKSCMIANIDGSAAVDLTLQLYDGSTYTALLSTISIPADNTLKLEGDEISFDESTYDLYATSADSDGQLTFTFNY